MNVPVAVGFLLLLGGAISGAIGLSVLGVLALTVTWLSQLWSRRGLGRLTYTRRLSNDRAVWGDDVAVDVTIHNDKILPLGWLETDDYATESAVIRERPLLPSLRPGLGVMRNVWSLGPFERVERRVHLEADQRGRIEFSRVVLSVADLFGRAVASREEPHPAVLIVRPRSVPVRVSATTLAPMGTRRARHGLLEDPALFAGVRPFQPGDPRRRIHARATARIGRPVSRRYEPSIARDVVIAMDVQTHDGPYWLMAYDEDVMEGLTVATASLARRFIADGAACGLAANGWTYSLARSAFVAPRQGHDQLTRIADMLGRLSSVASVPYEDVLAGLPSRLPTGALVCLVSARDISTISTVVRRLRATGFELRHVAMGPQAAAHAARSRRLGIDAVVARLTPDWRTSDALVLAG